MQIVVVALLWSTAPAQSQWQWSQNVTRVGGLPLGRDVVDLAISGDYAYCADEYGLSVWDLSEPELHGIWDLQVSDDSHDFGEGLIDSNAVWELTLTNAARQAVDILSVTVDSLVFSVEFDDTLTLEPDDEASFQVTFTPTEARDYSSALIIHTERRDVVIALTGTGVPLSAPEESNTPLEFALYAAYPNPFNTRATICYALPCASEVMLEVYDICGRRVENLFDGVAAAGRHTADWEAEDMPAGLYICRLSAGGQERSIKLLLVK